MSKIIGGLSKAVALLIGISAIALFAYDVIAIRPHLARIQNVLAQADPEDASPPQIICNLIDTGTGSLAPLATRQVMSLVYSDLTRGQRHVHNVLWNLLLPIHFNKSQMCGLYATLSFNGTDYGLSNFARREYGKPLSQLSPIQAATTVYILRAPAFYLGNRSMLDKHAKKLLNASQYAPLQDQETSSK